MRSRRWAHCRPFGFRSRSQALPGPQSVLGSSRFLGAMRFMQRRLSIPTHPTARGPASGSLCLVCGGLRTCPTIAILGGPIAAGPAGRAGGIEAPVRATEAAMGVRETRPPSQPSPAPASHPPPRRHIAVEAHTEGDRRETHGSGGRPSPSQTKPSYWAKEPPLPISAR